MRWVSSRPPPTLIRKKAGEILIVDSERKGKQLSRASVAVWRMQRSNTKSHQSLDPIRAGIALRHFLRGLAGSHIQIRNDVRWPIRVARQAHKRFGKDKPTTRIEP